MAAPPVRVPSALPRGVQPQAAASRVSSVVPSQQSGLSPRSSMLVLEGSKRVGAATVKRTRRSVVVNGPSPAAAEEEQQKDSVLSYLEDAKKLLPETAGSGPASGWMGADASGGLGSLRALTRLLSGAGHNTTEEQRAKAFQRAQLALEALAEVLWLGGIPVQKYVLANIESVEGDWSSYVNDSSAPTSLKEAMFSVVSELVRLNHAAQSHMGDGCWVQMLFDHTGPDQRESTRARAAQALLALVCNHSDNQTLLMKTPDLVSCVRELHDVQGASSAARDIVLLLSLDLSQHS